MATDTARADDSDLWSPMAMNDQIGWFISAMVAARSSQV